MANTFPDPEVSFIVPVYNKAHYIPRFISSLESIHLRSEYIFVDDGSTDDSVRVIDAHCERADIDYRIITQENGGVSSARNAGIVLARGRYIGFLDPDDTVSLEFEQVDGLCGLNGADLLLFAFTIVRNSGKTYNPIPYEDGERVDISRVRIDACKSGILNSSWSKLFKRCIIETNQVRFPQGIKTGEDSLFNLAFLDVAKSCVVCGISMIDYHVNEDSVTANPEPTLLNEALLQIERREYYALRWCLADEELTELRAHCHRLIRDVLKSYSRSYTVGYLWHLLVYLNAREGPRYFRPKTKCGLFVLAAGLRARGLLVGTYRRFRPVFEKREDPLSTIPNQKD